MAPSPRVICSFLRVHFWVRVSPVVVLQYYIYIRTVWWEKKFILFLQYGWSLSGKLLRARKRMRDKYVLAYSKMIIHFFLVRLVHIRSWYASLDDRASERKRNLHKTHFKNMPPNFWCNKRATKIIIIWGTKPSQENLGSICRVHTCPIYKH